MMTSSTLGIKSYIKLHKKGSVFWIKLSKMYSSVKPKNSFITSIEYKRKDQNMASIGIKYITKDKLSFVFCRQIKSKILENEWHEYQMRTTFSNAFLLCIENSGYKWLWSPVFSLSFVKYFENLITGNSNPAIISTIWASSIRTKQLVLGFCFDINGSNHYSLESWLKYCLPFSKFIKSQSFHNFRVSYRFSIKECFNSNDNNGIEYLLSVHYISISCTQN